MLTTSYATLGDDVVAVNYEKGCHSCGNENFTCFKTCDFECVHEEEEITDNEGFLEVAHTYYAKNKFCAKCYVGFEECSCGCKKRLCYECAESCERCPNCKAPICCEFNQCKTCNK